MRKHLPFVFMVVGLSALAFTLRVLQIIYMPILVAGDTMLVMIEGGPPSIIRCENTGLHRSMYIPMNGAPLYADINLGGYIQGARYKSEIPVVVLCSGFGKKKGPS